MSKKILIPAILSSLFMYSSVASACAYCDGYHDRGRSSYSENYSKLIRQFDDKKYELRKLYDQGVSESDDKAKVLIGELDSLSNQIQKERDDNRSEPNDRSRYNSGYDRGDNNHCW